MTAGRGGQFSAERAARLLSALGGSTRLVPEPAAEAGGAARYELRRAGQSAPLMLADSALVGGMLERDWLQSSGDGTLTASEAGRAWLARLASADEPFRAQHLAIASERLEEAGCEVLVVENESPLSWLRRRKGADGRPMLDEAQFAAGERLRRDFTLGQMMPRVSADWSGIGASRGRRGPGRDPAAMMDGALAARQRVEHAVEAVGPTLASLLVDICCLLTGLEEAESARRWPRRSGKIVLQIALDRLARHYGIAAAAKGPARARRVLHWGDENYRPSLNGQ